MKKLFFLLLVGGSAFAQQQTTSLYDAIIEADKAVFDAFNTCDIEKFRSYFTDDAEFYHDKGGVTLGGDKVALSVQNNICGNPAVKVRREAILGTFKVYQMDNYGAILTGDHYFYETINGVEKRTGRATFTHLWQYKDNRWKMTRVLSYDHHSAE